ncbi:MAG: BamA/TamA family outer membrane protein [Lentisphaeria bacterium]|nr:BamA/TamA family outer membrane protein [Lentisphaeria bacterium]
MTSQASTNLKNRKAISGSGKILAALMVAIFIALPMNAQITVDAAKQQVKAAKDNLKVAVKNVGKTEDAVKDASKAVTAADKTLVNLKDDKANLQRSLATAKTEGKASINSKIEALDKKIAAAEAARKAAAEKLTAAQKAAADAKAAVTAAEERVKSSEAALVNAEANDPVKKAKAALDEAKAAADKAERGLDVAEDTVAAARKDLKKAQGNVEDVEKSLASVEKEIAELTKKKAAAAADKAKIIDAKIAECSKRKASLITTKAEAEKSVKDMNAKLRETIEKQQKATEDLRAAKVNVVAAENQLKAAKTGKPVAVAGKKGAAPVIVPPNAGVVDVNANKIRVAEEKRQYLLSQGKVEEAKKVEDEIKALKGEVAPAAPAPVVKPAEAPAPVVAVAPAAPAAPAVDNNIIKVKENEEKAKAEADAKAAKAKAEADAKAAKAKAEADAKVKKEEAAREKAAAKAAKEAKKNEAVTMPWIPEKKTEKVTLQGNGKLTVPEKEPEYKFDDDKIDPANDEKTLEFDIAMVSGDRAIVEKLPKWQAWKEYVEFNKISPKDIVNFHAELIKALQEKGYVFATVEFPSRIWSTGIFLAKVDCGQLGDITVRNQKNFSARQIRRSLENKEGRFNYAKIHSDLYDLNARPDLKLHTSLKPVMQDGHRVINAEIEVEDKLPIHGAIELTNSAAKDAKNDWRVRATLQHLNITKHNDSLTVDWLTTGEIGKDMNAISASYFLPINDELSFNIYGGWNSSYTDDVLPEISVRGRGAFGGLQFSYIFYETLRDRYQVSLGWFYQRLNNYQDINGTRFDNGDITLSMPTITLGYTQKIFDSYQGRNFASITLQQNRAGTFGASSKSDFIKASAVDGDFMLAKLQLARFQRLFEGKDAPGKWTLFMKFDAQLASDRMPSATRDYVGGRTSVRGYEESELNGDHSFIGTLELRTPLIENFIPGLKKDEKYMKDNPDYWGIHRLQFILFTDFGYVAYDEKEKADDDNSLWSVGAGLRLGLTKYSQMALDYGYPIIEASDDTPDAGRLHLSVQLQF